MQDPNWLLSSLSQSTAAIAAMIGAFIFGRIVFVYFNKTDSEPAINSSQKREVMIMLIILVVMVVGGLIIPLSLMPVSPTSYNPAIHKTLPCTIFISSLAAMVGRLIRLMGDIKTDRAFFVSF